MDRPPAAPPSQVYTSDVLLLICTLVSLTFRACRQGVPPASNSFAHDGQGPGEEAGATSRPLSASPPAPQVDAIGVAEDKARLPAVYVPSEGITDAPLPDDGDGASTVLSVNAAADPLLILAERLTLEEKLSTCVNWLSLVSNCLTYFLRPSQVLYTFLFTNGDFVLFVTSYSNRYQRLHAPVQSRAVGSPEDVSPSPARRPRARSPIPQWGGEYSMGDTDAACSHAHHTEGAALTLHKSLEDAAAVSASPTPLHSPPTACMHAGPRHREAAAVVAVQQQHSSRRKVFDAEEAHALSAARTLRHRRFCACRPLLLLRSYANRCVGFAQTQLSWLLFLNALLTSTLFVFHLHHLFFFLGTLFGYLAAVASLFLCGMEVGCIVVRLRRRCEEEEEACSRDWADAHDGVAESGRDVVGGINGPAWAFVGEHLSAAGCSALYVWMLIEEGDALWSSHVDLMRWYVCSCALMALSLMKCLRAVV